MTQEQIIRRMLDGFAYDPPDTEYQDGFLAATLVIATEVMGLKVEFPLKVEAKPPAQVRPALSVIQGGKITGEK